MSRGRDGSPRIAESLEANSAPVDGMCLVYSATNLWSTSPDTWFRRIVRDMCIGASRCYPPTRRLLFRRSTDRRRSLHQCRWALSGLGSGGYTLVSRIITGPQDIFRARYLRGVSSVHPFHCAEFCRSPTALRERGSVDGDQRRRTLRRFISAAKLGTGRRIHG